MDEFSLAVDIGGTKLAAGLVGRTGTLQADRRVPTAADRRPRACCGARSAALVTGLILEQAPPRGGRLRGGLRGAHAPGGDEVSPLNIPAWRAFPLRRRLAELTGLPTFVDNDAKALALAEGWTGCRRRLPATTWPWSSRPGWVGGSCSTGGCSRAGWATPGTSATWWSSPEGRRCACGGRGCLEAEASGTAIAALTGRPPAEAPPSVVARTGTLVGRAVASVVNLLDLPLAVVAGSVALGFGEPFFEAARQELGSRARLDYAEGARLEPAGLGDEGPLVGAGAVGWRGLDRERPR